MVEELLDKEDDWMKEADEVWSKLDEEMKQFKALAMNITRR